MAHSKFRIVRQDRTDANNDCIRPGAQSVQVYSRLQSIDVV